MIDLELEEAEPAAYLTEIHGLMRSHRVTFYDAAYHGLALHRKGTLVTADAAYVKRVQASGRALLLSHWRRP
jgi:predicted nucleic acid-binding protein